MNLPGLAIAIVIAFLLSLCLTIVKVGLESVWSRSTVFFSFALAIATWEIIRKAMRKRNHINRNDNS